MYDLGFQLGNNAKISKLDKIHLMDLLKNDEDSFQKKLIELYVNSSLEIPRELLIATKEQYYEFMLGFQNGTLA